MTNKEAFDKVLASVMNVHGGAQQPEKSKRKKKS
jgi:hypothetical protein